MSTIVLVSGGFDPIHSGHIAYFEAAKKLGDTLVVAVNSDEWLTRKKGRPFMPFEERVKIIKALDVVDKVTYVMNDDVDDDASGAIFHTLSTMSGKIVFANGGDRKQGNVPEEERFGDHPDVEFVYGVGGEDKRNSSSWILKQWQAPKVERSWGHYRELYSGDGFAVKELVIAPHSKLSMQRHKHRSETWNLVSGAAHVLTSTNNSDPTDGARRQLLTPPNPVDIPRMIWHQGVNDSDEPAHIVEIWKGPSKLLSESDIERFDK